MPRAIKTIIESACIGCIGAIYAANVSAGTAAALAGQEDSALANAAFGICGAQIAVAVAVIVLVGKLTSD